MKKGLKAVLVTVGIFVAFTGWKLISSRAFATPTIPIGELMYGTEDNCGKMAIVKGKVVAHPSDEGFEIEYDGISLPIAVGKPNGRPRPLPAIGKNVEAHVFLVCQTGSRMVIGNSFTEIP